MTISIWETDNSRIGSEDKRGANRVIHYRVKGSTDEAAVVSKIKQVAPFQVEGYIYNGFSFDKVGYDVWAAEVNYITPQSNSGNSSKPPETGKARGTFSTKGGNTNIKRCIPGEQTSGALTAAPVIDMHDAINFDGEKVNGIDISFPALSFTVEYTAPVNVLTKEYLGKALYLTNRINTTAWKGFEEEQVLFLGFEGNIEQTPNTAATTLTYEFLISEPKELDYRSVAGLTKMGWDYAWITGEWEINNGSPTISEKQVNVCQVYKKGDFDLLNLPFSDIVTIYTPP